MAETADMSSSTFSLTEDNPSSLYELQGTVSCERLKWVMKLVTDLLVKYFNPKEILQRLTKLNDQSRDLILNDSLCDLSRGMRSLLEMLEDSDENILIDFYKVITTMDVDTGNLPFALLSGEGGRKHEMVSGLGCFIVELVEQSNIMQLTNGDVEKIFDEMDKKKLLKNKRILAKENAVDRLFSLLENVRKSNPKWSFDLWEIMKTVRPNLFRSGKADNRSPENEASKLSDSSIQASAQASDPKKLHLSQDIMDTPVIQMMMLCNALDSCQLSVEEPPQKNKQTRRWNDNQPSYSDGEESGTELKTPIEEKNVKLREYQKELCEAALKGENTIICAPTGSGKTMVVMNIIFEHLKHNADLSKQKRKVCFFARTIPLAQQQYRVIREFLPPQYKINLFTGDCLTSIDMHLLLPDLDVVVLTPMILQNHIRKGNIEGLGVFSLLVFDECHHTRELETYMLLMASYLDKKVKSRTQASFSPQLPQVVGLTASFPMEKAHNVEDAKQSILQLCANLDTKFISVVVKHMEEMKEYVPVPVEMFQYLKERDDDESFKIISGVMEKLEKEAEEFASDIKDEGLISLIAQAPVANRKLQHYNNWTVDVERTTVHLPRSARETNMSARLLRIIAEYLTIYHFALETHDLVHLVDVIDYLDRCFANFRHEEVMTAGETRFYSYFEEMKESMMKLCHNDNPNLNQLVKTVDKYLLQAGSLSRGIIFVKTRAIAEALVSWLNRCNHEGIKSLKASIFTGTNAKESQGGMTQAQQNVLVKAFRDGKVRLLVATSVAEEGLDVPECNLVIKYNHVGNEITTIQAQGRCRKEGGYSIMLAMPNICDKENLNIERTKLMYQGMEVVRKMDPNDFSELVWKKQKKDADDRELKALADADEKEYCRNKKFTLYCKCCKKFSIKSDDIRLGCGQFRVDINCDVWHDKKTNMCKRKYIDDTSIVGNVRCWSQLSENNPTRCNGSLGSLVFYANTLFLAIGIKNYIIEVEGEPAPRTVKQWKKLTYPIQDLTSEDIKNYRMAKNNGVEKTEASVPSQDNQEWLTTRGSVVSQATSRENVPSHPSLSTFNSSNSHHETDVKKVFDQNWDSGVV